MKILLSFPGHLKTVPMSKYIYQSLIAMGHDVVLFNFGVHGIYPSILKKISNKRFFEYINCKLKRLADSFKPDTFLTVFGFDHDRATIEYMRKKGIVTICWWLNDPFQFKRSAAQAGFYDYYFTNSKGSVNDYKKEGIGNIFYLPVGCYPPVHRMLSEFHNKKYDICFAGDWHPVREEILSSIAKDFSVAIFGPWKDKIKKGSILTRHIEKNGGFSSEEMVKIFNLSKIVINIHTWFGKWDYGINPRVFEANGCGSFQICDWKEEIPALYETNKEIVLYKSLDELKEKLAYFLYNEKERIEIAKKALVRSYHEHTYEKRLGEMFSLCKLI